MSANIALLAVTALAAASLAQEGSKSAVNTFKVLHADHAISPQQMEYIQREVGDRAQEGFFILQIELPSHLGTVPNGLYGPASGDAPIGEAEVFYRARGDRPWSDRRIRAPFRPASYVQAIGVRKGDHFDLFTVHGGPLAPQHPEDPGNRDPEGSRRFWAQHALATGAEGDGGLA